MRAKGKKFSIFCLIDRTLTHLEAEDCDSRDQADTRAEQLTAETKKSHVVVDANTQVQLCRFDMELEKKPNITAAQRHHGTGLTLAEAIASSRRVEKEEEDKEKEIRLQRRRAAYQSKAKKKLDTTEISGDNPDVETNSTVSTT